MAGPNGPRPRDTSAAKPLVTASVRYATGCPPGSGSPTTQSRRLSSSYGAQRFSHVLNQARRQCRTILPAKLTAPVRFGDERLATSAVNEEEPMKVLRRRPLTASSPPSKCPAGKAQLPIAITSLRPTNQQYSLLVAEYAVDGSSQTERLDRYHQTLSSGASATPGVCSDVRRSTASRPSTDRCSRPRSSGPDVAESEPHHSSSGPYCSRFGGAPARGLSVAEHQDGRGGLRLRGFGRVAAASRCSHPPTALPHAVEPQRAPRPGRTRIMSDRLAPAVPRGVHPMVTGFSR
jgi:hypothetical protein